MAVVTSSNTIKISFNQQLSYGISKVIDLPDGLTLKSLFQLSGVAADTCDLFHSKNYDFIASTPQTLNLKSLTDINGVAAAVVFVKVRLLVMQFKGIVDASYLDAGAEGSANEWLGYLNPAGAYERLFPGTTINHGIIIRQAPNTTGIPVGTTNRLWKLAPSAHAFQVGILIAGCSA